MAQGRSRSHGSFGGLCPGFKGPHELYTAQGGFEGLGPSRLKAHLVRKAPGLQAAAKQGMLRLRIYEFTMGGRSTQNA